MCAGTKGTLPHLAKEGFRNCFIKYHIALHVFILLAGVGIGNIKHLSYMQLPENSMHVQLDHDRNLLHTL